MEDSGEGGGGSGAGCEGALGRGSEHEGADAVTGGAGNGRAHGTMCHARLNHGDVRGGRAVEDEQAQVLRPKNDRFTDAGTDDGDARVVGLAEEKACGNAGTLEIGIAVDSVRRGRSHGWPGPRRSVLVGESVALPIGRAPAVGRPVRHLKCERAVESCSTGRADLPTSSIVPSARDTLGLRSP